jgi:hypothetical protein
MVMKRLQRAIGVVMVVRVIGFCGGAIGALGGCDKPAADDCRQAIVNMQKLLGTDVAAKNADNESEVRRCKGGSSKDAVACAIKATTLDELKACDFMGAKAKK